MRKGGGKEALGHIDMEDKLQIEFKKINHKFIKKKFNSKNL